MKKHLLIVALIIGMISCNKKETVEELTTSELQTKYGILIPEEEQTGVANGKSGSSGQKKWKVEVLETDDLDAETLSDGRDTVTVKNIPDDVTFGGVQRSLAVDDLTSWCNWYKPAGTTKGCSGAHVANSTYRGWYGTSTGFVKITESITLP